MITDTWYRSSAYIFDSTVLSSLFLELVRSGKDSRKDEAWFSKRAGWCFFDYGDSTISAIEHFGDIEHSGERGLWSFADKELA